MRVRLHLVAPPWAVISSPSVQLGVLQAYVEQERPGKIETRSYSAFLEILYRCRESLCYFLYEDLKVVGEEIYMLIYHARYLKQEVPLRNSEISRYLKKLNSHFKWQANDLGFADLEEIERHTLAYVEEKIIPELIDDGVNVIGFTMNFNQVYPSLVMSRMIRELAPGKKLLFLYGGFSASLPNIYSLMGELGIDGYSVFGEGEQRLLDILDDQLAAPTFTGALSKPVTGAFRIGSPIDLQASNLLQGQLKSLESLPLPAYEEYFELYDRLSKNDPHFARLVPTWVTIEGSRGCFAKCDFCNHNMQWSGFRKLPHEIIFEKVQAVARRYGVNRIYFVDNVADTFAEKLADSVLASGEKYRFYMNMRAHHPERFWIKLAAAGLDQCLIGIEALTPTLLRHMSKGTLVVQNFKVLKYLTELGVRSGSGIITHHPKSTESEARETLRLLGQIPHLDSIEPNRLLLGYGSPLYKELIDSELARQLRYRVDIDLPKPLTPYLVSGGYELPPQLALSAENNRLWSEVHVVCNAHKALPRQQRPVFSVRRRADGSLAIQDSRFGRLRRLKLTGLRARVFEECHEGLKLELLEQRLGPGLLKTVSEMVEENLLLHIDGYYFTLAIRPLEDCLARLSGESHVSSPRFRDMPADKNATRLG